MIGIIGSGSGGVALAKYFEDKGLNTIVWFRSEDKYKLFESYGKSIICEGKTEITEITENLAELFVKSKYIFIVTPAKAHKSLAHKLEDILSKYNNGHVLILYPGRTYGSLSFYHNLKINFKNIYETQTILHACRLENNNLIIKGRKQFIKYSTPFKADEKHIRLLNKIFPEMKYDKDYLGTTLNNMGALLHPIPLIFNGTRVESGENFKFYTEGLTDKVINYIKKVQFEKKMALKRLNCNYIPLYKWLNKMYDVKGTDLKKSANKITAYRELTSPKTLNHRYIFDDILTGLVPLFLTAKNINIETKALESFINLASNYMDVDFLLSGRKDLYNKYLSGDNDAYCQKNI